MYTDSSAIEVNPPGAPVRIMHDALWRGLVRKAENPVGIVPSARRAEIFDRDGDTFMRRMETDGGTVVEERITLTPPAQVLFTRLGNSAGWIANTITELDGRLLLVFTVHVSFPAPPGSAQERDLSARLKADYQSAMRAVIERARREQA